LKNAKDECFELQSSIDRRYVIAKVAEHIIPLLPHLTEMLSANERIVVEREMLGKWGRDG
jgi:hypothetical protein